MFCFPYVAGQVLSIVFPTMVTDLQWLSTSYHLFQGQVKRTFYTMTGQVRVQVETRKQRKTDQTIRRLNLWPFSTGPLASDFHLCHMATLCVTGSQFKHNDQNFRVNQLHFLTAILFQWISKTFSILIHSLHTQKNFHTNKVSEKQYISIPGMKIWIYLLIIIHMKNKTIAIFKGKYCRQVGLPRKQNQRWRITCKRFTGEWSRHRHLCGNKAAKWGKGETELQYSHSKDLN